MGASKTNMDPKTVGLLFLRESRMWTLNLQTQPYGHDEARRMVVLSMVTSSRKLLNFEPGRLKSASHKGDLLSTLMSGWGQYRGISVLALVFNIDFQDPFLVGWC